ncbi:MAG: hypothetical protein ACRD4K_09120 [Candidatus Acidiferrales bacterium]
MFSLFQIAPETTLRAALRKIAPGLFLSLLLPVAAQAQLPAGVAGVIFGDDVSVENPAGIAAPENSHSIYLTSGSKIVVHSGQGRMELAGGAEVGVCGPAELTLLEANGAFTLAVNFGRVHILLDSGTPISVYTPLLVAMPLAIGEGQREAVLGLDTNGAVCVRAMQGGIRLQNQLSGESLIVPQPKEIFLAPGELQPSPGIRGVCECGILRAHAAPPAPAAVIPRPSNTPPPNVPVANDIPAGKPAAPAAVPNPAPRTETEVSVPSHLNLTPPAPRKPEPPQPATEEPVWKVMMPPLKFDYTDPTPPPDPTPEAILLVREVRVDPAWEFHGRVEVKPSAAETKIPTKEAQSSAENSSGKPAGKKPGRLGRFFRRLFGRG